MKITSLFNQERMSDVRFIIGTQHIPFYAHKLVLAVHSQKFYEMFYKNALDIVEIVIPTSTVVGFVTFLKFFYTNEIQLTLNTVEEVMNLSNIYEMKSLDEICSAYLETSLREDQIFQVLETAVLNGMPKIQHICLTKIGENVPRLFKLPSFLEVNLKTLCLLFENELLDCDESDVFKAAIKWAEHPNPAAINKCLARKKLDRAIYLIRFPTMAIEVFDRCLDEPNIFLRSNEISSIFRCIVSGGRRDCEFPSVPRIVRRDLSTLTVRSCFRFEGDAKVRFSLVGQSDLYFSVNKYIVCCGIGIYGPSEQGKKYVDGRQFIKYQLNDNLYGCISSSQSEVVYDGTDKVYRLDFDKGVMLTPMRVYKATVIKKGHCNCYENYGGGDGRQTVTTADDVIFTFNKGSHVNVTETTNLNEGIISGIFFKV